MSFIRVLFGFALACLAAAATLVMFVYTPAELASLPSGMGGDRVTEASLFTLAVTPHVALFAGLPALLAIIAGEGRGISSWGYYVLIGIGIAVLGFLAQHFSESPGQTTVLHNYALTAFLSAGLVGGFAYWLLSGRFVRHHVSSPAAPVSHPSGAAPRKA